MDALLGLSMECRIVRDIDLIRTLNWWNQYGFLQAIIQGGG
jgi:hypothetical protein